MLLTLERQVVNLEESMGDVKEVLKIVEGCTNKLDLVKGQLKENVEECHSSNMDELQALFNTNLATMMTLNPKIELLERVVVMCRVSMGKKVFGVTPNHDIDVPKSKKFKGVRSIREVDNFLWEMDQYFCAVGIKNDDAKVEKEPGWIKTVNLKSNPTMRVAKGVKLQLDSWTNKETIEVIPLDDYDFLV
ncbi:hypothetical protein J1N35_044090 [Gossypium stocksii]|uniref:Uncharacterized protein n=1 Tax=Gossypium stocksii TaxID=47602 RepID=A0A9D3U8B8_9ROSI|nr:hypothetical protein J1N35_044090 [Gossypium stocksii]